MHEKNAAVACFFRSKMLCFLGLVFFFNLERFQPIKLAITSLTRDARALWNQKLQCHSLPQFSYFFKETERGSRSSAAGRLPINKHCTHQGLKNREPMHFTERRYYRSVGVSFFTFSHPISNLLLSASFTFCTFYRPIEKAKMKYK